MKGIFLFLLSSAQAADIGSIPHVYSSRTGQKITILRIGKAENKEFLVKVSGIDNEFNNLILKHKKVCNNTQCSTYKLETNDLKGKKRWWTFHQERSWSGSTHFIYAYGVNQKQDVYLDTKKANNFNPISFYDEFKKQNNKK